MVKRRAVGRGIVAAAVVVVVVIAIAAVVATNKSASTTTSTSTTSSSSSSLSSSSSSLATTSSTSSKSTSSSTASTQNSTSNGSPAIILGDLGVDVNGTGYSNLTDNESNIAGFDIYGGATGISFNVQVTITYSQCTSACPTKVTAVSVEEPGFSVLGTTPGTPIASSDLGTKGVVQQFMFTVNVLPPNTPYNGPLDILCQVSQ